MRGRSLTWLAPTRRFTLQVRCYLNNDPIRHYGAGSLTPALISRARRLAAQHSELQQQASEATEYTPEVTQLYRRVGKLENIAKDLNDYEEAKQNLEELQRIIFSSKDKELLALAQEDILTTQSSISHLADSLTSAVSPRHRYAHLPCIMEFRRGVGGDDAALFAGDLYRMYERYAAIRGWTWEVLSITAFDGWGGGGIVEAIVSIVAQNSEVDIYGRLRHEAGVHRVQRVPVSESQGRTHTSTASIIVSPQIDENETGEEVLNMDDVRVDVMRARGKGGQHVNTTESAIRMVHVPTGISVNMQDERSQHANRRAALTILRSRVATKREEERKETALKEKRVHVKAGDRSEKIRTWDYGSNRVTDHRGFKYNDLSGCIEGKSLDSLIDGVAKIIEATELEQAIAEDNETHSSQ